MTIPRPTSTLLLLLAAAAFAQQTPFRIEEASIADMQAALKRRRVTSRQLVERYLQRIALHEDRLNAALHINPRALEEADRLDRERRQGKLRGPLHGIPVALKDNIHTTDMPTTGGALAFTGFVPPYDATLTRLLRDGGAIILAKTGMTELANWIGGAPTPMPGNYNAVGGFGWNPYDPRRDPREWDLRPVLATGGSSSGIGTAANFWAANVGTETSGSILSPANQNMLAAIKPTVGRVSRNGIIPITADQDTAGPMARFVADAALLLDAIESRQKDPADAATGCCQPPPGGYTKFLNRRGLAGARIGIPRPFYYDRLPGEDRARGGLEPEEARAMAEAIEVLKREGAVIVDPAVVPSVVEPDPARNVIRWGVCGGADGAKGKDSNCSVVFKYGMKRDFNAWLASLGPTAPVKTLTELRDWNRAHERAGAMRYGQSRLDISDEMDLVADKARYEGDRARDLDVAAVRGIDAVMNQHNLDALLFPGANGAAIAARPGYPTVIVPFAMVANQPNAKWPEGFTPRPSPFGVSFTGRACSEPKLIELAYSFEQATRKRVPPPGF
ncbi:MAG: amidase [Acidobacteria bacterium]|nr:amidase [Acidobacteriota bacterium]